MGLTQTTTADYGRRQVLGMGERTQGWAVTVGYKSYGHLMYAHLRVWKMKLWGSLGGGWVPDVQLYSRVGLEVKLYVATPDTDTARGRWP